MILHNDIIDKIEKIHEGINNLEERTNLNVLRFKDRLWLIKHAIDDYRKRRNIDSINHLLAIFQETSIASLEGSEAYNESIWNANIEVSGKQTTLGSLLNELKELVEKYRVEK